MQDPEYTAYELHRKRHLRQEVLRRQSRLLRISWRANGLPQPVQLRLGRSPVFQLRRRGQLRSRNAQQLQLEPILQHEQQPVHEQDQQHRYCLYQGYPVHDGQVLQHLRQRQHG